jgi:hypothetical protein
MIYFLVNLTHHPVNFLRVSLSVTDLPIIWTSLGQPARGVPRLSTSTEVMAAKALIAEGIQQTILTR